MQDAMVRDVSDTSSDPEPEASSPASSTPRRLSAAGKTSANRRETLHERTEDDDNPGLTEAEFRDMLKDPDSLYKEIVELITKMRDLRAYSDNYVEQLREAKRALKRNEGILDRLAALPSDHAPSSTPTPESNRRVVKLPDPPLFNGLPKDSISFDNWLVQVKNKLRDNADSYPTEELRIIYAAGRVGGDALALISPRLNPGGRHAYETVQDLYDHLYELYDDPNKERNARQSFKDLTMKKGQTFQEFYALFLRYVADGNISSRDLKDEINEKLTWKLQESVATYYNDPAISTNQFARFCTTIDQQIRSRFEKRDQAPRKHEDTGKPAPKQALQPRILARPTDAKALPPLKLSIPDLKCYNCFQPGHILRDCPKPKTERTKQVLAAKLASLSTDPSLTPSELGNEDP
jgi:predicted house-cleaning noncanonical NTP pyrophosphatase (MazG superfamily)